MLISFSSIVAGLADDTAEGVERTAAFGFGLAIVPFVFAALAFLSRHRRAPVAVLKSLGIWVAVTAVVGLLSIVLGLHFGFGIAGMFSLRADEVHTYRVRLYAVGIGLVYTVVLILIAPALGLFAAATVPFIALGFGDQFAEKRAAAAD
jgi:hypothetical protein